MSIAFSLICIIVVIFFKTFLVKAIGENSNLGSGIHESKIQSSKEIKRPSIEEAVHNFHIFKWLFFLKNI